MLKVIFIILLLWAICLAILIHMSCKDVEDVSPLSKLLYVPRKSREIYDMVFAHRGFHLIEKENTLKCYKEAIKLKLGIELDVRLLKDGTIICFHDRYMKRLLGVPGEIGKKEYEEISNYTILDSEEKIPKLSEALKLINGEVPILIEIKGLFTSRYRANLFRCLAGYKGVYYIHCKNLLSYFRLRVTFGKRVFWVLNPFRRRFNFVKGSHYKGISLPSGYDLGLALGEYETVKSIINKIWYVFNRYTSRIDSKHFLYSSVIAHRANLSRKYPEHSREGFMDCSEHNATIECDVMWYEEQKSLFWRLYRYIFKHETLLTDGQLMCYHSDKASTKIGQPLSGAPKIDIENSISFEEMLKIVDGKVPIIIDIKDFRPFDRKVEQSIINAINKLNYKGEFVVQSFNPVAINWFRRKHPEIIRGMVGNSLSGLRLPKKICIVVNFLLFYIPKPDYIVYDIGELLYILSKFNNTVGLPVLVYPVDNEKILDKYRGYYVNAVCENLDDKEAWKKFFYIDENGQYKRTKITKI